MRFDNAPWRSPCTLAAAFATLLCGPLAAAAAAPSTDGDQAGLADIHARTARLVAEVLQTRHYLAPALDDAAGQRILDQYLAELDPHRLFFLAGDRAEFAAWAGRMDDALRDGGLAPVAAITARFRQRVDDWTRWLTAGLDRGQPAAGIAAGLAPPAGSDPEQAARWQARLRTELAQLAASGLSGAATQGVLLERYRQLQRRVQGEPPDIVFQRFINACLAGLDPHSAYYLPRRSSRQTRDGEALQGIGVQLKRAREYPAIKRIFAGGAAARSALLEIGDRVLAVGQGAAGPLEDMSHRPLTDVVERIRGPVGSQVRLRILPHLTDQPVTVSLVRDHIRLAQTRARRSLIALPDSPHALRVGVITVPRFYVDYAAEGRGAANAVSTSGDIAALIHDLQRDGIDGLILDLRGNRGGALVEAVRTTGLFLERGPVVQVRQRGQETVVHRDTNARVVYAGPLAVLIDRRSASASEIVAAAIQDYRRGLVIGERSYGKGTVQQTVSLNSPPGTARSTFGQLTITVAEYFRISGASTQLSGVVPDLMLPVNPGLNPYTERREAHAIRPGTITAVAYDTFGPAPDGGLLRSRHARRVAQDASWERYLRRLQSTDRRSESRIEHDRRWENVILRESAAILADTIRQLPRSTAPAAVAP